MKKDVDGARNSKDRILMAAYRQFAEHGYTGARVDEIAKQAKINKQAIYYYFGDKEALFRSSLAYAYQAFREVDQTLSVDSQAPEKALAELIRVNFDYLHRSPELIALITTANRMKKHSIIDSEQVRLINEPLIDSIRLLLKYGEQQGKFRKGVCPEQFYISVVSLLTFYFSNSFTLSIVLGRDLLAEKEVAARREHIVDLLLHSISANKSPL